MKVGIQPTPEEHLALHSKLQTALNGIMDRCPEAFKATLGPLKDEIDTQLAKMKPTDAAVAAPGLAYSLNDAASLFGRLQDVMSSLMVQAQNISKSVNDQVATALCEKVKEDVGAKITAGELVPKTVAEAAIAHALKTGRETALNELKTVADRKSKLAAAKIPLPSDESLLSGTDAEFAASLKLGGERLTSLNEKGVKEPSALAELVWSPHFDRDIKVLTSLNAFPAGNPFKPATGDKAEDGKAADKTVARRPIL